MCQLNAGQYYIGDPCYVIADDEWDDFLGVFISSDSGFFEYKGHSFFVSNTAYGDGSYEDNFGNTYPVDAGLIGAIPMELVSQYKEKDGTLYTFSEPFVCIACDIEDEGGISIGHIIIKTDENLPELDDEWDEDEEYDDD
jgi:hypothetical protein